MNAPEILTALAAVAAAGMIAQRYIKVYRQTDGPLTVKNLETGKTAVLPPHYSPDAAQRLLDVLN